VSDHPADLASLLRGCAWAGADAVPYPRADPADFSRLPIDTWGVAQLPVGVRLELAPGGATAIEVDYECLTDDLGYRGPAAGTTFTVWQGDERLDTIDADPAGGTVRLRLDGGRPGATSYVHLPEGLKPRLLAARGIDGELTAAPAGPRWLAYGDSITEGWVASEPGMAWPSIVARRTGLDLVNLGYAGSARGELASAEQVSALPADVISVFYGTNCWSRIPHSADLLAAGLRAFLAVLRQGHPDTPVVVVSMIRRPDAEATPNRLGATMADLRRAVEETVETLADPVMTLVRGEPLVADDELPDGIHPGDDAQWTMADEIGAAVVEAAGRA
jgi:lysophospholipase L1-like esterase